MRDCDYSYGEIPVSASVHSAQHATPKMLVDMARQIWGSVKSSGVAADDDDGNNDLLKRLQAAHSDFNQSFPLVLRWMVQMRKYNAKAFKKYLLLHASTKLSTREDFLLLQAEYLVILYRETHPHPDEGFVRKYRSEVGAQLLREDKAFLKLHDEVEESLAVQAKSDDADRRQRLYAYVLAQKVRSEQALGTPPATKDPMTTDRV